MLRAVPVLLPVQLVVSMEALRVASVFAALVDHLAVVLVLDFRPVVEHVAAEVELARPFLSRVAAEALVAVLVRLPLVAPEVAALARRLAFVVGDQHLLLERRRLVGAADAHEAARNQYSILAPVEEPVQRAPVALLQLRVGLRSLQAEGRVDGGADGVRVANQHHAHGPLVLDEALP